MNRPYGFVHSFGRRQLSDSTRTLSRLGRCQGRQRAGLDYAQWVGAQVVKPAACLTCPTSFTGRCAIRHVGRTESCPEPGNGIVYSEPGLMPGGRAES